MNADPFAWPTMNPESLTSFATEFVGSEINEIPPGWKTAAFCTPPQLVTAPAMTPLLLIAVAKLPPQPPTVPRSRMVQPVVRKKAERTSSSAQSWRTVMRPPAGNGCDGVHAGRPML